MNNLHYKTNNWEQYNEALINCGSLTFWIDKEATQLWSQTKRMVIMKDLVYLAT
ncbi:Mobile element protein [Candidatus Enterovibrio altilux]|uniref:Mobile element protein n=1 Tax=Candidatus Enterovibrio altilux TaxID=1927128 RepID=A0A291BBJ4_9GAMM|nr:Mobile element protein [Candidatus Enterovibrio luxaltus]